MNWENTNIMYADTHTPFKVVANIDLSIELSNPSVSDLSATKDSANSCLPTIAIYDSVFRLLPQVTAQV